MTAPFELGAERQRLADTALRALRPWYQALEGDGSPNSDLARALLRQAQAHRFYLGTAAVREIDQVLESWKERQRAQHEGPEV